MAIKTKAEFVSTEDFKTYTGIDLYEELNGDGKTPDMFLRDCEDELINYVNLQSWRPISKYVVENYYGPEQMDALKEAILIHARYVFYNGDIMENNGIDPETGRKFTDDERKSAAIAPNAIDKLKMEGILSLKMKLRF